MITYAADSHELYGELYFQPRGQHPPGARRKVVEWDSGKPLGDFPEAAVTYRVVGYTLRAQSARLLASLLQLLLAERA